MRTSKSLLCFLIVALAVSIAAAGCAKKEQPAPPPTYTKIGLITGTVSQGEDEYRAAQELVAKYADHAQYRMVHLTYPDNFMQEQETTIAQITSLGADKDVKAIVICQGVPGTAAGIDKVKASRPDIIFVIGSAHEDPDMIKHKAHVVMEVDNPTRGRSIPELAKAMGATKFLHYSFPRHMSMEFLSQRRDLMMAVCEEIGLQFVFVTAPDPMGPDGIPGTQQFILEDVPRQVKEHGTEIAFFGTNCGMMEVMIRSVMAEGAIFVEQCCPSPTHGYPGALGIDVKGMAGNMPAIIKAIEAEIVKQGAGGRMATWPAPINMVFIQAGVDLAVGMIEKTTDGSNMAQVKAAIDKAPLMAGAESQIKRYTEEGNMYLVILGSYIFGK